MLDFLLGSGVSVYQVIIALEFILAAYSVALALNTEKRTLKTVHLVSAVLWVVLALSNILV